jgi:hypothetical protein
MAQDRILAVDPALVHQLPEKSVEFPTAIYDIPSRLFVSKQECELMVLQAIGWELSLPTPHDFFDHLLRRLPLTTEQRTSVRRHAHTFAAMCITGKRAVSADCDIRVIVVCS